MDIHKTIWAKSSPQLIETFYASLPNHPDVERRKMFGYPCAFVNKNMFTGLHQENMIVRLPEARRIYFIAELGAKPFEPMPGRIMKEYIAIPASILSKPEELARLVYESFEYATSLPKKK